MTKRYVARLTHSERMALISLLTSECADQQAVQVYIDVVHDMETTVGALLDLVASAPLEDDDQPLPARVREQLQEVQVLLSERLDTVDALNQAILLLVEEIERLGARSELARAGEPGGETALVARLIEQLGACARCQLSVHRAQLPVILCVECFNTMMAPKPKG